MTLGRPLDDESWPHSRFAVIADPVPGASREAQSPESSHSASARVSGGNAYPYHEERFHQGIGGQLIRPTFANDNASTGEAGDCVGDEASRCVGSEIQYRSRLGGLLNFYYREAA